MRQLLAFELRIFLNEMLRKVIKIEMYDLEVREKLNVIVKKRHGGMENIFFAYKKKYSDFELMIL